MTIFTEKVKAVKCLKHLAWIIQPWPAFKDWKAVTTVNTQCDLKAWETHFDT